MTLHVATVDDYNLKNALRDFYEEYAACLDDNDFERWPSFFTDDAIYKIISRENYDRNLPMGAMSCEGIGMIHDRVTALVSVLVYEPRHWRRYLSTLRITSLSGDTIESRANFLLMESMSDREPQMNMLGQYIDQVVRTGSGFKLKSRLCVYDNYRILTTMFSPV